MESIVEQAGKLVALRKESVDRNAIAIFFSAQRGVALRKESVDRNLDMGNPSKG